MGDRFVTRVCRLGM